jgi:hypothetical protein
VKLSSSKSAFFATRHLNERNAEGWAWLDISVHE